MKMELTAPLGGDRHKDNQHSKSNGRHLEENDGVRVLEVILQKRTPPGKEYITIRRVGEG